jgi:hypothetical protein
MRNSKTTPIDWEFLIDNIRDQKCILILGPEAFVDENGISAHSRLQQYLDLPNNELVLRYYEGDDFVLFQNTPNRTRLCHKVKKFYQSEMVDNSLNILSQIPFHVFLTVTPDTLLCSAFENSGFSFQHGFYKKNTDPQEIIKPSKDKPLIYNLFGCIKDEESLILSHNDLYDYFKSIFKRQSMPKLLKDELSKILNIIFLGVPFEKWYFQLLLRELEIHNEASVFTRFAANQSVSDDLSTFCFEQFNINFVDKNIPDFILELHRRCAEANLLREKTEGEINYLGRAKDYLAKAHIDKVLNLLSDKFIDNSDLKDDLDLLVIRNGRLKKRANSGQSTQEFINTEEAQIAAALFELIKQAESIS